MQDKDERPESRQRTLGWLAETKFREGEPRARQEFKELVPEAVVRPYSVVKPGDAHAVVRTDVQHERDGITYISFNPPAFWEARYSVAFVHFKPVIKDDYLSHSGEELIVPVAGNVVYRFYWSNGTGRPKEEEVELRPDTIGRIHSQVPHHTWAAGKDGASAWMIFHHFSEVATASLLDSKPDAPTVEAPEPPGRIKPDLLDKPGRYALVAWGIAERVRFARVRANLSIAQLAKACGIDSSLLSRLETANTNISLDALIRVAQFLHLDLAQCIGSDSWASEKESLIKKGSGLVGLGNSTKNWVLRPGVWHLTANRRIDADELQKAYPQGVMSSWIVLSGRIVVDLPDGDSDILNSGCVLHLRESVPQQIQALAETRLLVVYCSPNDAAKVSCA